MSAAATITSMKAQRLERRSRPGRSAIGSPNTMMPPAIAETLAAALVMVMTGTASPFWRPRADA